MVIRNAEDAGQAIRERRKEFGYTQWELGQMIGCSTRLVSELERGRGSVGFEKVLAAFVALGLQVTVDPKYQELSDRDKWVRERLHRAQAYMREEQKAKSKRTSDEVF